ncbi:RNA polymerase sigma-70 factor (ECF subfamily) [Silvibacterium bohemicum]|uniref:RNA polymerase sigma-70 factor (ECF subfamily) n=1 Tax=Silvibacterium bohemicum TaxID=1577686 RepID=A0A841JWE9_9BACT|nr:sigma-70 family RNA polymerase sigma factor [Silvibacterium bohemicum]MBB6145702.1 RNA polymerase sigma-70 factor (ECF subfamily) [Silvibacterium bohemicum]
MRDEWTQPRLSGDAQQRILALYDEYRPHLYRYLRSMRLGREWAEEVIQETFMRLTSKLLEKDDIENVQGWVVRVAHNLAVDVLKEECRKIIGDDEPFLIENRADPSLNPEEAYCRNERSIRMTLALWELKPQHRQCFQMRAHGFRYKDIGVALGISAQRAAFVVKQVAMRLATICG